MEKLIDLLKIIAEKYLVQAVASVAVAILGVAFLPNLFGMTNRVGKTLYGVLIGVFNNSRCKTYLHHRKKQSCRKE